MEMKMAYAEFIEYVLSFYGADSELYSEIAMTAPEAILATAMHRARVEGGFAGDSVDREAVRDIVLDEVRTGVFKCEGELNDAITIIEQQADEIKRLRSALRNVQIEAEREKGSWVHLKRVIAVNCRAALEEQSK